MRVRFASKWSLALSACGAGAVVAGCQQNPGAMPVSARTAMPASVATADPVAVPVPPPAGEPVAEEPPAAAVSESDVIGWAVRGVSDDEIVDRIGHARSTFRLSAGDEMKLRDAGVSDDVIRAMKATAWN